MSSGVALTYTEKLLILRYYVKDTNLTPLLNNLPTSNHYIYNILHIFINLKLFQGRPHLQLDSFWVVTKIINKGEKYFIIYYIYVQTCHFDLTQNLDECEKKSGYTENNLNLTTKIALLYRNLYQFQREKS